MHIGGSTIDILTIIFVMLLLIFAYNSDNGFSLLILSELCWATLYTIYTLYGILFIVSTTNVISIFILVLAGVDCGIWVLFLVYYRHSGGSIRTDTYGDLKFLYRSARLLRDNRYIK